MGTNRRDPHHPLGRCAWRATAGAFVKPQCPGDAATAACPEHHQLLQALPTRLLLQLALHLFLLASWVLADGATEPYHPPGRYVSGTRVSPRALVKVKYWRQIRQANGSFAYSPHLLAGRPTCPQLSWDSNVTGRIYQSSATGAYWWEPDACLLRRLSAQEARSCLNGLPLGFIGDSVTRYQFLTMVHWLAKGKYRHPYDGGGQRSSVSNVELFSHDFITMFDHVKRIINRKTSDADSILKCNCDKEHGYEHWRFRWQPRTQPRKPQVDLYFGYGHRPLHERPRDGTGSSGDGDSVTWQALEWLALQGERDRPPRPRYVLFNACGWYSTEPEKLIRELDAFWPAAKEVATRAGMQLVWKACTTPRATVQRISGRLRELAAAHGVPTLSLDEVAAAAARQRLVVTWNEGTVHLLPFMYEQMNDLLLNIICPVEVPEQQQQAQQAQQAQQRPAAVTAAAAANLGANASAGAQAAGSPISAALASVLARLVAQRNGPNGTAGAAGAYARSRVAVTGSGAAAHVTTLGGSAGAHRGSTDAGRADSSPAGRAEARASRAGRHHGSSGHGSSEHGRSGLGNGGHGSADLGSSKPGSSGQRSSEQGETASDSKDLGGSDPGGAEYDISKQHGSSHDGHSAPGSSDLGSSDPGDGASGDVGHEVY